MIFSRERKEEWSIWNKIGFRFVFIYFSFYCFSIIGSGIFKSSVYWVAKNVLNIAYDFNEKGYGSGDTTFQYVLLFIIFCTSVFGTIIWSLFDKRKSYNILNYSLILLLRFVLIIFMFIYGFIKVFHMQMIPPTYSRLVTELGAMSPMGLAWTFMGYSKAYSMFAGFAEVTAGLLLVSRRLQSLGGIVVMAVMGNVFMMNMAFDIPVKIFSFHLLLMGAFLFLSDSQRFFKAIILKKAVTKEVSFPVIDANSLKIFRIAKAVIAGLIVILAISMGNSRAENFQKKMKPFLNGAWKVNSYQENGKDLPPLLTDSNRWKYFVVDYDGSALVIQMDDSKNHYKTVIDTTAKTLTFKESEVIIANFNYSLENDNLIFKGTKNQDTLFIKMKRRSDDSFLLKSRGFNWINESPYNQ